MNNLKFLIHTYVNDSLIGRFMAGVTEMHAVNNKVNAKLFKVQ